MYKTVYWHTDVRISTGMVKKAVYLSLKEGLIQSEELYGMDDDNFYKRMLQLPEELSSLIREAETPKKYRIVSQIPFDESDLLHRNLMDLEFRFRYEDTLAEKVRSEMKGTLPENHLIIDIPSRISFEVDLPILIGDDQIPFIHSGSVFSKPVVNGFTDALRYIRVIVPEEAAGKVPYIPLTD